MSVASSLALSIDALQGWSVLFAKEPAPAADPSQPDMDKTVVLGPPGKKGPTPPSMKERLLFLVLILIIVGGGGYLAVNPDLLMSLLGDAPGETPPVQQAPKVAKPAAPKAPAPAPAPTPAAPAMPAPAPAAPAPMASAPAAPKPAIPAPVAAATPAPAPVAPKPAAPAAPAPAPAAAATPAPAPAPAAPVAVASAPKPVAASAIPSIPTPKFGEGEKVSVSAPTPLTADAAGKKPGTATAAPGSTLVVVDADLQNFAWVYSVKTEQGVTGWVAEKNLVAK
jgi:hypothetical protein